MQTYFTYKSRPVVRKGKTIYYGEMAQPYVVHMNILKEAEQDNLTMATAIKCYLVKTDTSAVKRNADRETLYDALELAAAWLAKTDRK